MTGDEVKRAVCEAMDRGVEPAKQWALMAVDTLWDDAGAAGEILRRRPRMTKEHSLAFQRGIARPELFDGAK
jgi:hypothetical protein